MHAAVSGPADAAREVFPADGEARPVTAASAQAVIVVNCYGDVIRGQPS